MKLLHIDDKCIAINHLQTVIDTDSKPIHIDTHTHKQVQIALHTEKERNEKKTRK